MATNFQTQQGRPVPQKYALPDGSYPTPNINDVMIVEDVLVPSSQVNSVLYGTPHPKVTTAKLVLIEELEQDGRQVRIRRTYITERAAQDAYNYRVQYSGNDSSYPIFVRTYLERRDQYPPDNYDGDALQVVYRLKLTAGGTGYTSAPTVTATGGSGSGFSAQAEIQGGAVVALLITNCGTGYTSAPTIGFTGGGGSGAAATAYIQAAACVMVEEQAEPAPGPLGNLFMSVMRVYETLPGPALHSKGIEPETTLFSAQIRQRRRASDVNQLPTFTYVLGAIGGMIDGVEYIPVDQQISRLGRVVDEEVTDFLIGTIDGFDQTEYKSVGFQFPAIFTAIGGWDIPAQDPFIKTGPFPGIDYDLTAHRTASKPAEVVMSYSVGPSGSVPNTWTVTTPGNASREFPIGANTIHNNITLYEEHGASSQMIEDLPNSTPSSYTPGVTECIIQASEERWKGPIYRKVVITVSE